MSEIIDHSVFFSLRKKLPYLVTRDLCRSVRLSRRPSIRSSVRPFFVEITLKRGSDRSAEPIDLEIGLYMGN